MAVWLRLTVLTTSRKRKHNASRVKSKVVLVIIPISEKQCKYFPYLTTRQINVIYLMCCYCTSLILVLERREMASLCKRIACSKLRNKPTNISSL